jgi:ubiquinone/menaquinone biosynthesis C-methylase UbiE
VDFDDIAEGYEGWYETPRGQRASKTEKALLSVLLSGLPGVGSALDVGCGTGHFTRWLAGQGVRAVGLDTSPAMLRQARRLRSAFGEEYMLADSLAMPFPEGAFDVVSVVTALEFMPCPDRALAEAARVARRGLILGVLNRHSLFAWQRRWESRRGPSIFDRAHLFTVRELAQLAHRTLGQRLRKLSWRTTLLPGLWPAAGVRLPWGTFIGMLLQLDSDT